MKIEARRIVRIASALIIVLFYVFPLKIYAGQVTRTVAPTMISIRDENGKLIAETSRDQKYVHEHNGNMGRYNRGVAHLERGKKYTMEIVLTNYSYGGSALFDERVANVRISEDFRMAPEYFSDMFPLQPVATVNNNGLLNAQSTDGKSKGTISLDTMAREKNIATPEEERYRSYIYGGMAFRTTEFEITDLLPDNGVIEVVTPIEYTYSGDNLAMADDVLYLDYKVADTYETAQRNNQIEKLKKEKEEGIGTWVRDNKGWWYRYTDGTWPVGQWVELKTGEKREKYYFDNNGYALIGWNEIDGKWYYFCTEKDGNVGAMMRDVMTPDGNYVNENGVWEPIITYEYKYVDALANGVDPLSPEMDYSGVYGAEQWRTDKLSKESTLTIAKNNDGTYHIVCSGNDGFDKICRLAKGQGSLYSFFGSDGKSYVDYSVGSDTFFANKGPFISFYSRYNKNES